MKLLAKSIEKSYKGRKVVKGISLEVAQGEIVGLLGPNGAGKTTSFYMIVGLIKPNDGFIYLNDQDITKFPMYQRAQRGIGYLAQEASIFRKLSVEENVLSVLQMTSLSKNTQKEKMESPLGMDRKLHLFNWGPNFFPPIRWEMISCSSKMFL